MTRDSPGRHGATYDFDLHGIVGVRLLDATQQDLATVRRQLGPLQGSLRRDPDITVRFTDRATEHPLTYVGMHDAGFNRDGFFVLRRQGSAVARALLPLDDIGRSPQIVCERALPAVPHLLAMINLTALSKGVLPLHASAFTVGSRGVLVTGWAKSGKTESLLAAMREGGSYVGDEWVYLTSDRRMWGLPEPIRLWAWHLEQLPALLRARSREQRLRLSFWKAVSTVTGAAAASSVPGTALARKGAPVAERQAYVQVPPADLFGEGRVVLHADLDAVVLVLSHESPTIDTAPAGPTEVSGRMAASLVAERAPLLAHYRQFRYAFPDRGCEVLERADAVERDLLATLFDGRPAATVAHPYPCDIAELGRAVLAAAHEVLPSGAARHEVPAS
jgi:hypothetical protein